MQIAHSLSTEAFTNYTFFVDSHCGVFERGYVRNWTPMQRLSCFIYGMFFRSGEREHLALDQVHITLEELENATVASHFGFVF